MILVNAYFHFVKNFILKNSNKKNNLDFAKILNRSQTKLNKNTNHVLKIFSKKIQINNIHQF